MSVECGRWYPVAASADVPPGHVYQTRLGGHPLALWRTADGRVNVWTDRCPHRGVRFSVGTALADELRCQYHGWRFAAGTGACTAIPAMPGRRPAAAIRAQAWPAAERAGMVWTGLDVAGAALPEEAAGTVLRALPVDRAAAAVEAALAARPIAGTRLIVQPVEAGRCVIRGVAAADGDLLAIDGALERRRRALERAPC